MIKVYHCTNSKNLNSIFKLGLLKKFFVDKVVYVFKNYDRAVSFISWDFREMNSIIELNVNERKLKRGSCYDTIKEYYLNEDVKSNRIIGAYIIDNENGVINYDEKGKEA